MSVEPCLKLTATDGQRSIMDRHVSADEAGRNTSYRRLTYLLVKTGQPQSSHRHSVCSYHNQAEGMGHNHVLTSPDKGSVYVYDYAQRWCVGGEVPTVLYSVHSDLYSQEHGPIFETPFAMAVFM